MEQLLKVKFSKYALLLLLILTSLSSTLFAKEKEKEIVYKHTYQYRNIAGEITGTSAPYEVDGHVVFTAKKGPRFVGIVFDFENYKTIHPFELKTLKNMDLEDTDSWYFYILELPKNIDSISYRLVIDGLWTTDPLNRNKEYDLETGIQVSKVNITSNKKIETEIRNDGNVHFVYTGKSGSSIRVGGSFTNWDSWIYEMKETSPGFYELSLPLPTGIYYYAYFIGTKQIPDYTNPRRAFTEDGRNASVLEVQ